MPAIYLDKLKLQSANLAGKFGQSDEFMDDLLELFEFYSDRTFRAGNNTLAGRLHISYHLPERVFWQIERDLETQINIFPQEHALRLAGLLWTGESLEEKKLAVFILGRTSVSPSQPVLETYRNWFEQEDDSYLRQELVANGLLRLRREAFAIWLPLVQEWVTGRNEQFLGQGYLALAEYIRETGDRQIPAIIGIIRPTLLDVSPAHHPELLSLIRQLFKTSPVETVYLLQEVIAAANSRSPGQKRIIRKMVQIVPPQYRQPIKIAFLEKFREKIADIDEMDINSG